MSAFELLVGFVVALIVIPAGCIVLLVMFGVQRNPWLRFIFNTAYGGVLIGFAAVSGAIPDGAHGFVGAGYAMWIVLNVAASYKEYRRIQISRRAVQDSSEEVSEA